MNNPTGRVTAFKTLREQRKTRKRNSPNKRFREFLRIRIPRLRQTLGYSTILEPLAKDPTAKRILIRRLLRPNDSTYQVAIALGIPRITVWKAQERACEKLGLLTSRTSFEFWSNERILKFLKENPKLNRPSDVKGPLAVEIKRRRASTGVELLPLAFPKKPRKLTKPQQELKQAVETRLKSGEKLKDIAAAQSQVRGELDEKLILNVFSDNPRMIHEICEEVGQKAYANYERALAKKVRKQGISGSSQI
jgi:hypothetical protein